MTAQRAIRWRPIRKAGKFTLPPADGEHVIRKRESDSFFGTTLQQELEKRGNTHLIVAGGMWNRKSQVAVQDSFRPLDDLKNWEVYVGQYRPVLLIRATPKLKETGGSMFVRSLAAAGGAYNVPAKLRFKADFYKMKLACGSKEIVPILPGKIAHVVDVRTGLVTATDATYEGFYEYPADSIGPSCGHVTLTLYGEKDPNKAFTKNLDDKSVARIFEDFGPYRSQHATETQRLH